MTNLIKKGLNFFGEKLGKKGKDENRIFITGAILEKNNSDQDVIAFYLRKANQPVNLDANHQKKLATDFVDQAGKTNLIKLDEVKGKLTAHVHTALFADTEDINKFVGKLMQENILDKNDKNEDELEKVIAQEIIDRIREHEIESIVAPEPHELLIIGEEDEQENMTQAEKDRKLLKKKEKLETNTLKEEKHFKNAVENINDKYTKLSKELLGGEGKKYDMPERVQVADKERREKINEKEQKRIIRSVQDRPDLIQVNNLIGLKRK